MFILPPHAADVYFMIQSSNQKRWNHNNLKAVNNSCSRKRQIIKKITRRC